MSSGSKMSLTGIQLCSSGPYHSQSMRFSSRHPLWCEHSISLLVVLQFLEVVEDWLIHNT